MESPTPTAESATQPSGCFSAFGIPSLLAWCAGVPLLTAIAMTFATDNAAPHGPAALLWIALSTAGQLLVTVPLALTTRQRAPSLWALSWVMTFAALFAAATNSATTLSPAADMRGPALITGVATFVAALAVLVLLPLFYARTKLAEGNPFAAIGWRPTPEAALFTAFTVAGVLLLPWVLVGSLGDPLITASITLTALAAALGEEAIFRGLGWELLTRTTGKPVLAALISVAASTVFLANGLVPTLNWGLLGTWFFTLLFLLLATELRARAQSIWPSVLVRWVGLAAFALFTDPRTTQDGIPTDWGHILALLALFLGAGLAAGVLALLRLIMTRQALPVAGALAAWGGLALVTWLTLFGAWAVWGAPGFHSDGFMLVLKEQAPLDSLPSDPLARRVELRTRLLAVATRTQPPVITELERRGLSYRRYYLVNAIRVDSRPELAAEFAQRADIAEAYLNPYVRPYPLYWPLDLTAGNVEPGTYDVAPGLVAAGADTVWDEGYRGAGIVVAGQDTGVDWTHPALKPHYRGWQNGQADHNYNWYDAWDNSLAPHDDGEHGTHTMGTMVGDDGTTRTGMAPEAQWIACRNMRYGVGNPSSYLTCMEFFLAPYPLGGDPFTDGDPTRAPDVVNNSWGCPTQEGCAPDTLRLAVIHLYEGRVMMVVSAGNEGPACSSLISPPANYAAVFTVGAATNDEDIATFSSRGPVLIGTDHTLKPDVSAPGVDVLSTVPGGRFEMDSWQGTSMAGPHVAGLVALLWSANPHLRGDIDATEAILRTSARDNTVSTCVAGESGDACGCGGEKSGTTPNYTFGYGVINAAEAVRLALEH